MNTPGNHGICHCDPYSDEETPVLIGQDSLKNLQRWYFYRGFVVGEGKNYWFIFNEKTEIVQVFHSKEKWEIEINKKNLKPHFTRWLTLADGLNFLTSLPEVFENVIWIFFILLIIIPTTVLYIRNKKIPWKYYRNFTLVMGLIWLLLFAFFDTNSY